MHYTKPPLSIPQQIERLSSRGLVIGRPDTATEFLANVNYYRLSAYFIPFQIEKDRFSPGTLFETVINLYRFDQDLRMVIIKALETVEISLRTRITQHLVLRYGAFAHTSAANFARSFNHDAWHDSVRKEIGRSKETFVGHYREKYTSSLDFPLWMLVEACSFGSLSLLYAGMKNEDKQAVADAFAVHRSVFKSWLHTMVYIRNTCAHHARVWNREISIRPEIPESNPAFEGLRGIGRHRIFSALSVIHYCLRIVSGKHSLRDDLDQLFNRFSFNRADQAGFPLSWKSLLVWTNRQVTAA